MGTNTKRVRELINGLFNGHDADLVEEYYAPNMRWHGGSVGSIEGAQRYAAMMRSFFAALPDVRAIEKDILENGESVAARFVIEGTHWGSLWGIPATGRRVKWDAVVFYRFEGGKIAEQWAAEDWTAILQGVGAVSPPWATGSTKRALDPRALADGLIRIGEIAIAKRDDAAFDRYFAKGFVFHGPSGDTDLSYLRELFEAMRNAFEAFAVKRDRIIVEGHFVAARTVMSGVFEHELTHSPIGPAKPTKKLVRFVIHNIFRYDDQGRLAEEWAQFDNLEFLKQLGVERA